MTIIDLTRHPWRQGRKVGRTIYAQIGEEPSDNDILIGMMDTPGLAEEVVLSHNNHPIDFDYPDDYAP